MFFINQQIIKVIIMIINFELIKKINGKFEFRIGKK